MTQLVRAWHSGNCLFLEDPGVYLGPGV